MKKIELFPYIYKKDFPEFKEYIKKGHLFTDTYHFDKSIKYKINNIEIFIFFKEELLNDYAYFLLKDGNKEEDFTFILKKDCEVPRLTLCLDGCFQQSFEYEKFNKYHKEINSFINDLKYFLDSRKINNFLNHDDNNIYMYIVKNVFKR